MKTFTPSDNELLDRVRIATPCPARWDDMEGDERARYCSLCRKHVYNFGAMTGAEVAALVREKEGNLCGRFYRRPDGRMLTADCPVGAERSVTRFKRMIGAALAGTALLFTALAGASLSKPKEEKGPKGKLAQRAEEVEWQVKEWLGINPPPMPMPGIICVMPTPSTNTPPAKAPPPVQGK